MTFEEKLKKFKCERVGFIVNSEKIAKELLRVFTKEHMEARNDNVIETMSETWEGQDNDYYVTYNYHEGEHKLSYGEILLSGRTLELLDVTLEELKAYNG